MKANVITEWDSAQGVLQAEWDSKSQGVLQVQVIQPNAPPWKVFQMLKSQCLHPQGNTILCLLACLCFVGTPFCGFAVMNKYLLMRGNSQCARASACPCMYSLKGMLAHAHQPMHTCALTSIFTFVCIRTPNPSMCPHIFSTAQQECHMQVKVMGFFSFHSSTGVPHAG